MGCSSLRNEGEIATTTISTSYIDIIDKEVQDGHKLPIEQRIQRVTNKNAPKSIIKATVPPNNQQPTLLKHPLILQAHLTPILPRRIERHPKSLINKVKSNR